MRLWAVWFLVLLRTGAGEDVVSVGAPSEVYTAEPIDCTAGVLCSFSVLLRMAPAEDEVVTVVLKPEPGGQARLRFVTPETFVPLSDVQASNASQALEFVDQAEWRQLPFRDYLTFDSSNWNVPQKVHFQVQALETFADELCWGVYSPAMPESPKPCVLPMTYQHERNAFDAEVFDQCTTKYNEELWQAWGYNMSAIALRSQLRFAGSSRSEESVFVSSTTTTTTTTTSTSTTTSSTVRWVDPNWAALNLTTTVDAPSETTTKAVPSLSHAPNRTTFGAVSTTVLETETTGPPVALPECFDIEFGVDVVAGSLTNVLMSAECPSGCESDSFVERCAEVCLGFGESCTAFTYSARQRRCTLKDTRGVDSSFFVPDSSKNLFLFKDELCAETTTTLPILPSFDGLPKGSDALTWCAVSGNTANRSLYSSGAWGWCNCSSPTALRRHGTQNWLSGAAPTPGYFGAEGAPSRLVTIHVSARSSLTKLPFQYAFRNISHEYQPGPMVEQGFVCEKYDWTPPPPCEDFVQADGAAWVDGFGFDTCATYEEQGLCIPAFSSNALYADSNGFTADDACCACGGGHVQIGDWDYYETTSWCRSNGTRCSNFEHDNVTTVKTVTTATQCESLCEELETCNLYSFLADTTQCFLLRSCGTPLRSNNELEFVAFRPGNVEAGCTDSLAENFNAFALYDDGSCSYLYGCTDSLAENYDATSNFNDGSCSYTVKVPVAAFSVPAVTSITPTLIPLAGGTQLSVFGRDLHPRMEIFVGRDTCENVRRPHGLDSLDDTELVCDLPEAFEVGPKLVTIVTDSVGLGQLSRHSGNTIVVTEMGYDSDLSEVRFVYSRVPKPWEIYTATEPLPQLFVLKDSYLTTTVQCNPGFEVWNLSEAEIESQGGFGVMDIRPRRAADFGAPVSLAATVVAAVAPNGYYYSPKFDPDNEFAATSTNQTMPQLQFYYQQCRRCQVGMFSIDGFECVPCPAQARCIQALPSSATGRGLSVAGSKEPLYLPGFWTNAKTKPQLGSNFTNGAFTCPFPFAGRCPGGLGSECGSAYENGSFLCGQCSNKSVQYGGKCHECSGLGAWIGTFPSVNLWWWVLLLVGGRLGIWAHIRCIEKRIVDRVARTEGGANSDQPLPEMRTVSNSRKKTGSSNPNLTESKIDSSGITTALLVVDQIWHVPQLLQAFLQGVWSLSRLQDFSTVLPPFFRITVFSGFLGAMDFPAFLLPTLLCYSVAIRDGTQQATSVLSTGFLHQLVVAAALPFVIMVLVAVAFQIYVALVKARVLFPDHGRSRSSAKVREPIDSGSSAADATDTGDVTAAVVDGKKVPVMFLSQRQRQKLGLKNVFDDAEALKQRRLAGASEPKALADEKVGRASRALQLLAVAEKEMGIRHSSDHSTKDEDTQPPVGDDLQRLAESGAGIDDDGSAVLQTLIDETTWPFTVTIWTFLLAYVPILRMASRVFECSDFGAPTNGSAQLNSWVVVDPDLNCFEHEHVLWMVFAGIIIAIYGAVMPASCFCLLIKYAKPPRTRLALEQHNPRQSQRTKPQKASSGTKSTGNKLSADLEKRKKAVLLAPGAASTIEDLDDIFTKIQAARRLKLWRQRLWLLYRAYTPQYFYFEAVEMVFQVLCFGLSDLLCQFTGAQFLSLQLKALLVLSFLVLHFARQPFAVAHFNLSKQLSLLCLLGIFEAAFLDAAWIFSKDSRSLFENSGAVGLRMYTDSSWNATQQLFDMRSGSGTGTTVESVAPYYEAVADAGLTSRFFGDVFYTLLFMVGIGVTAGSVLVLRPLIRPKCCQSSEPSEVVSRSATTWPSPKTFKAEGAMTQADSHGRSSYELERDWVHLSRLKNHALERLNKAMVAEIKQLQRQEIERIEQVGDDAREAALLAQQRRKQDHVERQLRRRSNDLVVEAKLQAGSRSTI
eukprot:INCI5004.4.p1 GENE.INCI5004.4~~INCI5004.4.p1  ORF type:complete len:1909 (-),score=302.54 INCI5004.4:476-6202(-)